MSREFAKCFTFFMIINNLYNTIFLGRLQQDTQTHIDVRCAAPTLLIIVTKSPYAVSLCMACLNIAIISLIKVWRCSPNSSNPKSTSGGHTRSDV